MTAQPSEVRKQAWEQLLRLLSGRTWQFLPEHWACLISLAKWHHVLPILYRELIAQSYQHEFNDDQLQNLHLQVVTERKKLLLLTRLQQHIHKRLSTGGIRALFFKGIVAGQWLYGSNLLRQCRDIDLVVHPDDHEMACEALYEENCFRLIPRENLSRTGIGRYQAAMKDYSLVHRPSGGLIELHWSMRPFEQAFQFDFDEAWEKRSSIFIDDVPIPVFDESTHIRYLAAHGCNSHWGRLCWLMDWLKISQLEPDWDRIVQDCANTRETSHLKSAFALTNQQFDIPIPDAIKALPEPRFSRYMLATQCRNQLQGKYPNWFERQMLLLACQQDVAGGLGYISHMIKKALAADTLPPGTQP